MTVRQEWLDRLLRIVSPVLNALAEGRLKETLPQDFHPDRARFAPLEAFARSMLGLAPWLEADPAELSPEERKLQRVWREKALVCLDRATDPASPDAMLFDRDGQPLVDTAFLAHAVVRAPRALAGALNSRVRRQLADAFRSSRRIPSGESNWMLFTAMVEAGLFALGEECDLMRILAPLRAFQGWYLGDGIYGDGPRFRWDSYNSFVIQPMLTDLVRQTACLHPDIEAMRENVLRRAARHASQLERMIGPDGSYPVIGRSVCYRFGSFQMLAQAALQHMPLPGLSPAAVRCGLTAVIRRVSSGDGMFDGTGFLRPGIIGSQPELAEYYINTGSLYLCSAVFLPLGLSPADAFWADPDADWTSRVIWGGGAGTLDHAVD